MKIAIFGTGGIGGYFGGKLAKTYISTGSHQVYFLARGNHLDKINKQGLTVKAEEGDFTAFPTLATERPEEIGKVDFVLRKEL